VAGNDDRALTRDLAQVLVAQAAPQECVVFPSISDAYFVRKGQLGKAGKRRRHREDEELGFGGAETITLLTPLVMAAVDSVMQELVTDLIHNKVVQSISQARAALRRMFRLDQPGDDGEAERTGQPDEPLALLDAAQWARIRRLVITTITDLGGTQQDGELVANALVVAGQGMLEHEQP
jgi:hypothetical protein